MTVEPSTRQNFLNSEHSDAPSKYQILEAPISAVFEYDLQVQESDIDEMDHVANLVYLKWTLKAAVAHSTAVGWGPKRYREFGAGFIVRSHQIKYRRPALLGDDILIRTWIASFERVSSVRKYEILNNQSHQLLAEAETNWAFVDLADMKLRRIPEELTHAFLRDERH